VTGAYGEQAEKAMRARIAAADENALGGWDDRERCPHSVDGSQEPCGRTIGHPCACQPEREMRRP
jgi:hypothetical protein